MRKILFIAATHGDEGFSIPQLEKLVEKYPKDSYGYDWIVGNPKALKQGKRYTEKDLNRSAPGDPNSPYYEERRAAEILKTAKDYDLVIDLHGSVGNCGVVSIIPYPTRDNLLLASAVPVSRNVIWYSKKSSKSGPAVQHTDCPAIEIECGPKKDQAVADELYKVLEKIVQSNAKGTFFEPNTIQKDRFYDVYGVLEGEHDASFSDFVQAEYDGETFFPFMSNQYPMIKCYKMREVTPTEIQIN